MILHIEKMYFYIMILNRLNDISFKIRRKKQLDETSFLKIKQQLEDIKNITPQEVVEALNLLKDNFEEIHSILNNRNLLKILNNNEIARAQDFEKGLVNINIQQVKEFLTTHFLKEINHFTDNAIEEGAWGSLSQLVAYHEVIPSEITEDKIFLHVEKSLLEGMDRLSQKVDTYNTILFGYFNHFAFIYLLQYYSYRLDDPINTFKQLLVFRYNQKAIYDKNPTMYNSLIRSFAKVRSSNSKVSNTLSNISSRYSQTTSARTNSDAGYGCGPWVIVIILIKLLFFFLKLSQL